MCTLIVLRRPEHPYPLLVAANRDERLDRSWQPPARHWPERAEVIAGLDEAAGGTWLGANEHGVVAAILNRTGTLGPVAGKRTRGELVLEALDHADAIAGARALAELNPDAYRPFNLFVGDDRDAFWLRNAEDGRTGRQRIDVVPVAEGLAMLTSYEINDLASRRIRRYLPRWYAAPAPEPDAERWQEWQALLAATEQDPDVPSSAMCFDDGAGYGTVCSSLIAVPAHAPGRRARWRFAAGRPDRVPFAEVAW